MSSEKFNLTPYDKKCCTKKKHMSLTYYLSMIIVIIASHATECTQGKLITPE